MGRMIQMKCECGYSTEKLYLGGGRLNYDKLCNFPYYCKDCESLLVLNVLDEKVVCKKCNSTHLSRYDSECLSIIEPNADNIFSWNIDSETLILKDGLYFCPRCKKYKMEIWGWGVWD